MFNHCGNTLVMDIKGYPIRECIFEFQHGMTFARLVAFVFLHNGTRDNSVLSVAMHRLFVDPV